MNKELEGVLKIEVSSRITACLEMLDNANKEIEKAKEEGKQIWVDFYEKEAIRYEAKIQTLEDLKATLERIYFND